MEKVLCAAIWIKDENDYVQQPNNIDKGFVLSGFRHGSILQTMAAMNYKIQRSKQVQGFLTSENRFLDRVEARELVLSTGQLHHTEFNDKLYSEDLY